MDTSSFWIIICVVCNNDFNSARHNFISSRQKACVDWKCEYCARPCYRAAFSFLPRGLSKEILELSDSEQRYCSRWQLGFCYFLGAVYVLLCRFMCVGILIHDGYFFSFCVNILACIEPPMPTQRPGRPALLATEFDSIHCTSGVTDKDNDHTGRPRRLCYMATWQILKTCIQIVLH